MILITGGAGYVGSHFLRTYLASQSGQGSEAVVIDNLKVGHKESLPEQGAIFIEGDIGDQNLLDHTFKRYPIEAVVHFAAYAYVGESQQLPFKYLQNNLVQSVNLLEAMERNGVRKIVFSSTCATYGNPLYLPLDEQHVQQPVNVYGNTKLLVERALASLYQTLPWSYVALRYFNAAGADSQGRIGESHDPETHLIPLALQAAMGKIAQLNIFGDDYQTQDGTCIRDYIHVNDLAQAHLQALDLMSQGRQAECINLGTARGASVKEVVRICEAVTGRPVPLNIAPRRPGDPAVLVANWQKAKTVLGWKPEHDLKSIVESAFAWEQNRRY